MWNMIILFRLPNDSPQLAPLIRPKNHVSVTGEHPFKDKCVLYQFRQDRDSTIACRPPAQDIAEAEEHLHEALSELSDRGPDAWLRMILRKP